MRSPDFRRKIFRRQSGTAKRTAFLRCTLKTGNFGKCTQEIKSLPALSTKAEKALIINGYPKVKFFFL